MELKLKISSKIVKMRTSIKNSINYYIKKLILKIYFLLSHGGFSLLTEKNIKENNAVVISAGSIDRSLHKRRVSKKLMALFCRKQIENGKSLFMMA